MRRGNVYDNTKCRWVVGTTSLEGKEGCGACCSKWLVCFADMCHAFAYAVLRGNLVLNRPASMSSESVAVPGKRVSILLNGIWAREYLQAVFLDSLKHSNERIILQHVAFALSQRC
jgi:hypothetical protein